MEQKNKRSPGRPCSDIKRKAIVQAAAELFLDKGYEQTSMDDVAKQAGVSKQTVYGHYQNKENLFRSVIIERSEELSPSPDVLDQKGLSPLELLRQLARGVLDLMYCEECIRMHQLLIGNMARKTKAVELFFEAGPQRMLTLLEKYFSRQTANNKMSVPNPRMAADHFFAMLTGSSHIANLLEVAEPPSQEQREQYVDSIIEVFRKAYDIVKE